MKLTEVAAGPKIGLDDLFNALEEHGVQVSFDDFEEADDGKTATASFSNAEASGDVKFSLTPKGVKVEARGEGQGGREEQETLGTFPFQSAKDMAEAIDAVMGRFAHDLDEDEDEDD